MPQLKRDARAEFAQAHIPGAVFFDIDAIADRRSPLPHMLPRAAEFARGVAALGIGDGDRVIVYDSGGVVSAARVWWTRASRCRGRAASPRAYAVDWCAICWACAATSGPGASRCSTPARGAASPEPSRSRAGGCGRVTFPG